MHVPTKADIAAADKVLTHLSHPYSIPYTDGLGVARVFVLRPNRDPAKASQDNWPADKQTQAELMDRFLIATYRDSRDGDMVKAWLTNSSAFEVGLTDEELDFATNTPYSQLVSHAIGDERFEQWYLQDREEEQREVDNSEARDLLRHLRGLERYSSAALQAGCGYLNAELRRVINTSSFDKEGNLHVDTEAGQKVLSGFVGLMAAMRR